MKAEERKEIETNSLARWLSQFWTGSRAERPQRSSSLTFLLVAAAVVLIVIIGWNWWSGRRTFDRAERWVSLDLADTEKLKEIAEKYRDTLVGKAAKLRLARVALGPEGLSKLGTTDSEERKKAVASIQEARDLYTSVAPDLHDSPVLAQEAWVGAAKAEEALIGVPKAEGNSESLGSLDKVIEFYEKARQVTGDSKPGAALQETIDEYRASKDKLTQFYTDVNRQLATPKLPPLPSPSLPPLKKE